MFSTVYNTTYKTLIDIGLDPKKYYNSNLKSSTNKKLRTPLGEDCILYTGDNLEHLESLAMHQAPFIDFIYIDPPYNTGSAFLYNDSRKKSTTGIFGQHSEWMAFMAPRLIAAKELMKNDAVIAISIDDYEYAYLKVLLDNIFGEGNFIGSIIVCRSKNGKGSKRNIASNHEYILVYGKSKLSRLPGASDDINSYDKEDENGNYRLDGLFRKKGEASRREDRPNMFYPIYYDSNGKIYLDPAPNLKKAYPLDSKGIERRWLWSAETAKEKSWKLYASPKGTIYVKNYFSNGKRKKLRSLWSDNTLYYTEKATSEIKNIFGDKVFDTPKPLNFIKDIIQKMSREDSVILDFFAGSGTTAHAAYELNKQDSGKRKVLLMESNECISSKHIAYEKGFQVISEITEKRLKEINKNDHQYTYSLERSSLK